MKIKELDGTVVDIFGIYWNDSENTFSDKKETYFFGLPRNKGAAGVYRSTEVTVIDSELNFNTIMYIFESKAKGIYHWALIKEKLLDGLIDWDEDAYIRFLEIIKAEGLVDEDFY